MNRALLIATAAALFGAWARPAEATECGDARQLAAHWKAAAAVEEQQKHAAPAQAASTKWKAAERRATTACAPQKATIAVLPLGLLSVPPGSASTTTFEAGERWRLAYTTLAGAASGLVMAEPATIDLPRPFKWETAAQARSEPGELLLFFATGAPVTVEEVAPGKGAWRIEVKKVQQAPLSQVRACAAGKPGAATTAAGLTQSGCELLLRVDPLSGRVASSLPARGRAALMGEWHYCSRAGIDLGDDELTDMAQASTSMPEPRLDLVLELSAPIAGLSDGKKLAVTLEGNRQANARGATLRFGHECGDDEKCEAQRFLVEVWYDRVLGVPFVRPLTPPGTAVVVGRIADRLERPIAGQRVQLTAGNRRITTITDKDGGFRFDNLAGGEVSIFPVGRRNTGKVPRGDMIRTMSLGAGESKMPRLLIDKLFE